MRRTGQRLVAVVERFLKVLRALVGLRNLPVGVGYGGGVGRELLEEILVHGQLLLIIRLLGDGLQGLVLWRARRNHEVLYLSRGESGDHQQKGNQQDGPAAMLHTSPP